MSQSRLVEMRGATDHPLISRYAGAVLQNSAAESFASVRVPAGPGRFERDRLAFADATSVEGRISSYFYVMPKGSSALEVFRNYQSALRQAGFGTMYSCEMRDCDKALIREAYANESVQPRKWSSSSVPGNAIERDVRFISAKATRHGADIYVEVFVAEPDSVWKAPVAVVLVAEPAPGALGKVVVGADQLKAGMAAEGKVALYGIYFDTGRAEMKPESKPQLDEMARLLAADPAMKVLIVGHTDNVGAFDQNLALSKRRAEAIVSALVATYHVDTGRLRASGAANISPAATNRDEAGRARNRRVEMVEQ